MGQEDVKDSTPAGTEAPPTGAKPPAMGAPVSPEAEIQQLRQELAEKDADARANYNLFLRERAELDNFKKRIQREKAEALRFACEPLIREVLPVIDNLERAVQHANGDSNSVVEGVRMVLKSLLDVLSRHGVKRIDAVGELFDPSRHEAIAQVESAEHEPNRVVQQHHSGYLMHDRLLRPALVTVSRRKGNGAVETGPNSG